MSFFKFINESEQRFTKTIALVAGSFKPPTAGHLDMVLKYRDMANSVKVIISDPKSSKSIRKTCFGTAITPEMSKKVWELYIQRYGLSNVTVEVSTEPSPITAMFKYVDEKLNNVNVIFGVSKKDDDVQRFKSASKYYADNPHIHLIDPAQTAVKPFTAADGKSQIPVSATAVRDNLDKPEVVKSLLPAKLTDDDIKEVIEILSNGKAAMSASALDATRSPLDEIEDIDIVVNDDILKNAKISAYNVGQMVQKPESDKKVPVNPKKFPTKAVDIIFPVNQLLVEVFLDTDSKRWDSDVIDGNIHMKLSPEQMGQFFSTQFYQQLLSTLERKWPRTDVLYSELFDGMKACEMKVGLQLPLSENDNKEDNDSNASEYTASGRKIVTFSNSQVSMKDAMFYCWPDPKDPFRLSQWKDWRKVKPLCRARFKHGEHVYGLSLSTIGNKDDFDKRGFRGYDLTEQPPIQWLSKEENVSFMRLNIIDRFLKKCISRITEYVSMDPEEVAERIGKPDSITAKEIAKTQQCVRQTMNEVIKKKQVDSFSWK